MYENVIDFAEGMFAGRGRYIVSGRMLKRGGDVGAYLATHYPAVTAADVESVYGNVREFSPLYGGRPYRPPFFMTDGQVAALREMNIGLCLPLTNHFFTEGAYVHSVPMLEKYHDPLNSVVCTNDELAQRVRKDFPRYRLRASIIKEPDTPGAVAAALALYDDVTVPMDRNDDDAFLASLPEKERVVLFANALCAYTCPRRSCYRGISEAMLGRAPTAQCSKADIPRRDPGAVYFDVPKYREMGFRLFKLIPLSAKRRRRLIERAGARRVCTSWKTPQH